MQRLTMLVICLPLLAFALPPIVSTVEGLIVPAIILTALVGIVMFLFQRGRRW